MQEKLVSIESPAQYNEIYHAYKESNYGRLLDGRARFRDFMPYWCSDEQWIKILGADVDNLEHMYYTFDNARDFTALERVSYEDYHSLLVTAITHDWGEAIIGDIPITDKTSQDDRREAIAYRRIDNELGFDLSSRVLPVLFGSSEVAEMFRAIEYIGYCKTGQRAGRAAEALAYKITDYGLEKRSEREQMMGSLLSLSKAVEVRDLPKLSKFAEKYKSIVRIMGY